MVKVCAEASVSPSTSSNTSNSTSITSNVPARPHLAFAFVRAGAVVEASFWLMEDEAGDAVVGQQLQPVPGNADTVC